MVEKNKKEYLFAGFLLVFSLLIILTNLNLITSVGETSSCCEKTTSGAWCQNAPAEDCNSQYRKVPSSCEATSYCKLGTCVNTNEGECMENTPQKVCDENKGKWFEGDSDQIAQCNLGCCLIGDQAAFVTQTRCTKLAAVYGLETAFRKDINNEVDCISSARSETKGACVFEEDAVKTCRFISKRECLNMGASLVSTEGGDESVVDASTTETEESEDTSILDALTPTGNAISGLLDGGVEFHEGFLCSAEELGTVCGPSEQTTCLEERDEIFFLDTCGNLANVYDASRKDDPVYWSRSFSKSESCGARGGNANSATCGNCDYYLGSTCKEYKRGQDNVKPNYGDYICRDLNCNDYKDIDDREISKKHGETWCAKAKGVGEITLDENREIVGNPDISTENLPGSRYFRLVCYNGDVTVEPCADFRQEVCVGSNIGESGFSTSACRVNMWQSCVSQDNKRDCENSDRRDCKWVLGTSILRANETSLAKDENGNIIEASCLPKYAPGFDFGNTEGGGGETAEICSVANNVCDIKWKIEYEGEGIGKMFSAVKDLFGGDAKKESIVEGAECVNGGTWKNDRVGLCLTLGDCGIKTNYLDYQGYYDNSDWDLSFKGYSYDDDDFSNYKWKDATTGDDIEITEEDKKAFPTTEDSDTTTSDSGGTE